MCVRPLASCCLFRIFVSCLTSRLRRRFFSSHKHLLSIPHKTHHLARLFWDYNHLTTHCVKSLLQTFKFPYFSIKACWWWWSRVLIEIFLCTNVIRALWSRNFTRYLQSDVNNPLEHALTQRHRCAGIRMKELFSTLLLPLVVTTQLTPLHDYLQHSTKNI